MTISGSLVSVSKLRMGLQCFSIEMGCYVSWLVILFALSSLEVILQVFMLYCLSCTPVLWLVILVARNF